MSLHTIERLFGDIAMEKGYISDSELVEALTIQLKEKLECKPHRIIGQILRDMGRMNISQIERVLGDMHFPMAFCMRHLGAAHEFTYQGALD